MTDPTPDTPPLTGAQKAWTGFVVSLVLATIAAVVPVLAVSNPDVAVWLGVAGAVVTAVGTGLGVYTVTNQPKS